MAGSFRDAVWALSPPRLRTARAAKLAYGLIGLPLDVLSDAAMQAVKARFPETCPEDALPYLGRDRGILRGPLESAASYRARLLLWISAWRSAGIGRAILDQLAGYLTPQACRIRVWTQRGVVYTRGADGSFTVTRAAGAWDWDGDVALWARFWVIIDSVGGVPWSRDGTWGDGERWGDNATSATWGSTATIDQVLAIRGIIEEWKPAAAVCHDIIVSFDAAAFDIGGAPPLPDPSWTRNAKIVGGVAVPSRDPRAIYWRGTP